jgi:hypothetical protein
VYNRQGGGDVFKDKGLPKIKFVYHRYYNNIEFIDRTVTVCIYPHNNKIASIDIFNDPITSISPLRFNRVDAIKLAYVFGQDYFQKNLKSRINRSYVVNASLLAESPVMGSGRNYAKLIVFLRCIIQYNIHRPDGDIDEDYMGILMINCNTGKLYGNPIYRPITKDDSDRNKVYVK